MQKEGVGEGTYTETTPTYTTYTVGTYALTYTVGTYTTYTQLSHCFSQMNLRSILPFLMASTLGITSCALPQSSTDTMPDGELYYLVEGSVYDGDTLRVQRNGEELKIRLCGIDAPEMDQQFGIESRDHLRSLIGQGIEDDRVIVLPVERDRYGRTVAEIFVPMENTEEEIHLTSQMVADGMAYHYERYSDGCPNGRLLTGAEEQARSQGVGVWADPDAVKPWEYRKSQ